MKKKINLIFRVAFIFLIFQLTSCGRQEKEPEDVLKTDAVVFFRDGGSYTEQYAVYTKDGKSPNLWYFDVTTKQSVPYCFDPSCDHRRAERDLDGNIISKGCISYELGSPLFINEGSVFYYSDSENCIYRTDLSGNNRKAVARLSRPYGYTSAVYFTENEAFLSYNMTCEYKQVGEGSKTEWIVDKVKEMPEIGVIRVPLDGSGEEVLFRSDEYYEMQVCEFHCFDGRLHFVMVGKDRPTDYEKFGDDFQALMEDDLKHTVEEGFEYTTSTNELRKLFFYSTYVPTYFFDKGYGILNDADKLEIYHYDGEKVAESEIDRMDLIENTRLPNHEIIGRKTDTGEFFLMNPENGEILKKASLKGFVLNAAVGNSYYGIIDGTDGQGILVYISAADFWNGNEKGIVPFSKE